MFASWAPSNQDRRKTRQVWFLWNTCRCWHSPWWWATSTWLKSSYCALFRIASAGTLTDSKLSIGQGLRLSQKLSKYRSSKQRFSRSRPFQRKQNQQRMTKKRESDRSRSIQDTFRITSKKKKRRALVKRLNQLRIELKTIADWSNKSGSF